MSQKQNPLGQLTDYPKHYAPDVLFGIPRSEGRAAIGLDPQSLPFQGVDIWTHYELSWLNAQGKPCAAIAEIRVPADSPRLIESKSMKLYFNSLNFERFESPDALRERVQKDLSTVAEVPVGFRLMTADELAIRDFPGVCLDDLPLSAPAFMCSAAGLRSDAHTSVSETLYTHLLRSLCPVTQQPDWGSVLIQYEGPAIDHASLLAYIVAYRDHADFHEQCVERIFHDIIENCCPQKLTVYARYTRRGGLDINPFRSNSGDPIPVCRIARQ